MFCSVALNIRWKMKSSYCHYAAHMHIIMQNINIIIQNKKAQLTLTNPRDAEACKNCSNSTCFVSFHRIPFRQISNYRCMASRDRL